MTICFVVPDVPRCAHRRRTLYRTCPGLQSPRIGATAPNAVGKSRRVRLGNTRYLAATKAADELGIGINCAQKVRTPGEPPPCIEEVTTNDAALDRLADGRANVVGATLWLWADSKALNTVDVLFVDEAGQMSLANVLAASQAARSVVLLGDPQQLDQPQRGSHPEGVDVSALEHMLGDHKTIPSDRGIFLSETWRLAPSICKFTSEVFYEGRLFPRPALELQVLVGTSPFEGAGLWVDAIRHEGNQR